MLIYQTMFVHICAPYRLDKNLGRAYNEVMQLLPEDSAACFIDYDVQLLTPDAGAIIHQYAAENPHALLTCYTNRVSPLSKMQLLNRVVNEESDIRKHISLAEKQKSLLYQTTPIYRDISGMLMVIPKSLWLKHPFPDSGVCLGVDTYYGRSIREAGVSILRMDGLYVWHSYRLLTGITDKSHLA